MTISGSSKPFAPMFCGYTPQKPAPLPITPGSSATPDQFVRFGKREDKDANAASSPDPNDQFLASLSRQLDGAERLFASLADVGEMGDKPQFYLADEDYQDAIRQGDMDAANRALDWKIRVAGEGDFLRSEPMGEDDLNYDLEGAEGREMDDIIFRSADGELIEDNPWSQLRHAELNDLDKQQFALEHRLALAVRAKDVKGAQKLLGQLDNLEAGKTRLIVEDWQD